MACLFLALHISDLSRQSEKYFAEKAKNINIPLRREHVYRKPRIFIYFSCQPHEYLLGLMGKSETKKEPRDISARKCPCSHLVSLSRVACFTWHSVLCILCTAGMKLTCQHIFRSGEMFQSNGRLLSRLGLGGGGGVYVQATLMDPIRCFYLSKSVLVDMFAEDCMASEHSIKASQLLYNSVYLFVSLFSCSQLNLSCSSFELYIQRMFLILRGGGKACLGDILTASKRCIKKPCDRFIQCRKFQLVFMYPCLLCAHLNAVIEPVNN